MISTCQIEFGTRFLEKDKALKKKKIMFPSLDVSYAMPCASVVFALFSYYFAKSVLWFLLLVACGYAYWSIELKRWHWQYGKGLFIRRKSKGSIEWQVESIADGDKFISLLQDVISREQLQLDSLRTEVRNARDAPHAAYALLESTHCALEDEISEVAARANLKQRTLLELQNESIVRQWPRHDDVLARM